MIHASILLCPYNPQLTNPNSGSLRFLSISMGLIQSQCLPISPRFTEVTINSKSRPSQLSVPPPVIPRRHLSIGVPVGDSVDVLGKGTFGHVVRCCQSIRNQTRFVAVKFSDYSDCLSHELDVLSRLDHPNIVRLLGTTDLGGLVLEDCSGGELFSLIAKRGPLGESEARGMFHQVLRGLNYLHTVARVVHRDLKPENILLSPTGVVRICDFGTAVALSESKLKAAGRIGSLSYAAPEVYISAHSDYSSDMWSAGVILYVMLCAASPFRRPADKEPERMAMDRVKKGDFNKKRRSWRIMTNKPKNLISKLLKIDSNSRLSAAEALGDDWFQGADGLAGRECHKFDQKSFHEVMIQFNKLPGIEKDIFTSACQQISDWDYGNSLFHHLDTDQTGLVTIGEDTYTYSEVLAIALISRDTAERRRLVGDVIPFVAVADGRAADLPDILYNRNR
jgi:calcium-dependent protein kinase